jgi:ribosomal protein S13
MRLIEVAQDELSILVDAWAHIHHENHERFSLQLIKGVDREKSYEVAKLLYIKAHEKHNFEDELGALRNLSGSRSMPGIRSCMRVLRWTGFCDIYPINMLDMAVASADVDEFKRARGVAMKIIMNAQRIFAAMRRINGVATDHTNMITMIDLDVLDAAVCKAALKKLGLPIGDIIV